MGCNCDFFPNYKWIAMVIFPVEDELQLSFSLAGSGLPLGFF
jgi:hypothetical protein